MNDGCLGFFVTDGQRTNERTFGNSLSFTSDFNSSIVFIGSLIFGILRN